MNPPCVFSKDYVYRYTLWRIWDKEKPYVMFIGLNPSTADDQQDDPTVRRCINFSKDWNFGGMCMTNIFAFRATNPKIMLGYSDPIGTDNDGWLKQIADDAGLIVAAWGTHGGHKKRNQQVLELLDDKTLYCLQLTKHHHPKHPLYVPKKQTLIEYNNNKNKEIIWQQNSKIPLQKKYGLQHTKTTLITQ